MKRNRLVVIALAASTLSFFLATPRASAEATATPQRQATVEERSETVMPFDMTRTMHVFAPTATGGVQSVVSHDGDPRQIALIRSHLRKEARAFAQGDFADPAAIHGTGMPGLAALRHGAKRIAVAYADTVTGASITYTTSDPKLVSAIHDWFAAQVSDHGAHAMMMGH